MLRQPRLDAPGTLHHVMGRGTETGKIFGTRKDREDFVEAATQKELLRFKHVRVSAMGSVRG
jgi:hypothetical protein